MSEIIDVGGGWQNGGGYTLHMKTVSAGLLVWGVVALCLEGCAGYSPLRCPAGLAPMTTADLFFGLGQSGGGEVSAAAWQGFLDEVITPRFPDGLTIEEAQGQWKGTTAPLRERAKHVIIVLKDSATTKLDDIRAAYKSRFHQQSVLLTQSRVCGSF